MSDLKNFQKLVDEYYEALYRFGYSLAKSQDQASDLVQQTFCIWAEKGHQLKNKSKAKTWLFTTLYREFLGQNRRFKKFPHNSIEEEEYDPPTEGQNMERIMDGKKAVQLLDDIEEIYKAPLILFFLQQHSYKEIATILKIPIGTVMSRISRGKEQLRSLISERNINPNLSLKIS